MRFHATTFAVPFRLLVTALFVGITAGVTDAASLPVRADVIFDVADSPALNGPLAGMSFAGQATWDPDAVDPSRKPDKA